MALSVHSIDVGIQGLTKDAQAIRTTSPIIVLSGPNNCGKTVIGKFLVETIANPLMNNSSTVTISIGEGYRPGRSKQFFTEKGLTGIRYKLFSSDPDDEFLAIKDNKIDQHLNRSLRDVFAGARDEISNYLREYSDMCIFKSIEAERGLPSGNRRAELVFDPTGESVTSDLDFLKNDVKGDSQIIREIVKDLNSIFETSLKLSDLEVLAQGSTLSVHFRLSDGSRVDISRLGTGLRNVVTIVGTIRALLFHWRDRISKRKPQMELDGLVGKVALFIDEPELFMHAGMLRSLCQYFDSVADDSCQLVIATHSPVVLEFFAKREKAALYHLRPGLDGLTIKDWSDQEHSRNLEALGNRPSELLAANGVLWVEGPSERVLFRQALSRLSDGRLKEDLHYKFAFYAGSLLSNYLKEDNEVLTLAGTVGRFNDRFLVISDSDRTKQDGPEGWIAEILKKADQGVEKRSFIGERRTLENYYPRRVLETLYPGVFQEEFNWQFDSVKDRLKETGNKIEKTALALKVIKEMNDEDWKGFFDTDLGKHLKKAVEKIARWNDINLEQPAEVIPPVAPQA